MMLGWGARGRFQQTLQKGCSFAGLMSTHTQPVQPACPVNLGFTICLSSVAV